MSGKGTFTLYAVGEEAENRRKKPWLFTSSGAPALA
jgi:hypothetical protein